MSPDKGGAVDVWWVSLGTVLVGWAATIIVFIYTKGRERGRTDAKIDSLELKILKDKEEANKVLEGITGELNQAKEQLALDREAFRETLRKSQDELQASLVKMERMFTDSNGNPRLMSVKAHESHCGLAQKVCAERFSNIKEDQKQFANDQIQRDHEIFNRLRNLEAIPGQIDSLRVCFEGYISNSSSKVKDVSDKLDKHIDTVAASRRDRERT
jgi:hypothetical protein